MTSNERILQPFTLPNGTELKNRLLMAPMTTCTGYFDGTVTSELVEYYRAAPAASAPLLSSAALLMTTAWPSRARSASIMMKKLPAWRKSPRRSKRKVQKRFCRSITADAWSTRS